MCHSQLSYRMSSKAFFDKRINLNGIKYVLINHSISPTFVKRNHYFHFQSFGEVVERLSICKWTARLKLTSELSGLFPQPFHTYRLCLLCQFRTVIVRKEDWSRGRCKAVKQDAQKRHFLMEWYDIEDI